LLLVIVFLRHFGQANVTLPDVLVKLFPRDDFAIVMHLESRSKGGFLNVVLDWRQSPDALLPAAGLYKAQE
jgi:hypothetical protein